MTDRGTDFNDEERLQQAAGNWWVLLAGIVDYLREQGQSPQAFAEWFGKRVAPGWDGVRGDLERIAYFAALNPVSVGAELRHYEVGEDEATMRLALPEVAMESMAEDMDLINIMYRFLMDYLDVDVAWEQDRDLITLRLRQSA